MLLDRGADVVPVTDRAGESRGVLAPNDFVVSPTAVCIAPHDHGPRAATVDDMCQRARRLPSVLDDLLARG